MATIQGHDRPDQFGRIQGFGVLGTGTPAKIQDQGQGEMPENSVGVWGIVGTADDISTAIDDVTNNFDQRLTAAVVGMLARFPPGTLFAAAYGFLGGNDPQFNQLAGAYGESAQQGVMGLTTVPQGTGVYGGGTTTANGEQIGVRGETVSGVGVQGQSFGTGLAGRFIGNVALEGDLVVYKGDIKLVNADVAEDFTVSEAVDPGSVMVVENEGQLQQCREAYDRRVAGVISGGNGYRPGIVLDRQNDLPDRAAIALAGKTYCKVDAAYGPIQTGDLLTTSPTLGHAMKALDPARAFGTVIGKALRPHMEGCGMIPILVALQ